MGRLEAPRIMLSQAQGYNIIPYTTATGSKAGGDDSLARQTINAHLLGTLDPGSGHNLVWSWLDLLGNDLLALLLMEIHCDFSKGDDRNWHPCEKL